MNCVVRHCEEKNTLIDDDKMLIMAAEIESHDYLEVNHYKDGRIVVPLYCRKKWSEETRLEWEALGNEQTPEAFQFTDTLVGTVPLVPGNCVKVVLFTKDPSPSRGQRIKLHAFRAYQNMLGDCPLDEHHFDAKSFSMLDK